MSMTTFRATSHLALTLACAASLLACASEDSATLETSEIKLHFTATLEPRDSKLALDATVFLAKGSDTLVDVDLSGGDSLVLVNDQNQELLPERFLAGQYTWHLDSVPETSLYRIELRRQDKASALGTTVRPQPALAFTSEPLAGRTFEARDSIDLAWSNPLPNASVFAQPEAHPCGGTQVGGQVEPIRLPDTGSGSLRAGDLLTSAPPAEGVCVSLRLQRAGGELAAVDPGLYKDTSRSSDDHGTSYAKVWRNESFEIKIVP